MSGDGEGTWAPGRERQIVTVARNISTRYLAILAETVLGLVMLPFNLGHLGPTEYGLWVLLGSITVHFSVLDLGYAGALVKFMAQYRAHRNAQALNEIASTLFFVFAGIGLVAYAAAAGVAFNLDHLFKITPEQAETGKWVLLIIAVHVSLNFPFSVYGGVISGFQRYDANNMVAVVTSSRGGGRQRGRPPGRPWADCPRRRDHLRARRRVLRLPDERLPHLPGPAHPAVAVPARPPARGHRLQRLLVDHRLGQQAELPARRTGDWRDHGAGGGGRVGPGRADHFRRTAPHQPAEWRAVPGDRGQRRLAAEGAAPADPPAGHEPLARDGRPGRGRVDPAGRSAHSRVAAGTGRGDGRRDSRHPDSRGRGGDPRRQRDRYDAPQRGRQAPHARVREPRRPASSTSS